MVAMTCWLFPSRIEISPDFSLLTHTMKAEASSSVPIAGCIENGESAQMTIANAGRVRFNRPNGLLFSIVLELGVRESRRYSAWLRRFHTFSYDQVLLSDVEILPILDN